MVSLGVSKCGKTSIHFVEPGVKVNSQYYCNTLLADLIPEMKALSGGDFTLQQDGARSHTSVYTLQYLRENKIDLLEPEFWPPNSPDLNPVDYSVWQNLSSLVYTQRIRDVDHLRQRILSAWDEFPQEHIDAAIDQFRLRLNKVIHVKGGHIEQFF